MALVVRDGKPAGPRPEDELVGLPYLDALSPEEQAAATELVKAEVITLSCSQSDHSATLVIAGVHDRGSMLQA